MARAWAESRVSVAVGVGFVNGFACVATVFVATVFVATVFVAAVFVAALFVAAVFVADARELSSRRAPL